MAKDWTPRTEVPPMPGMRDRNLRSGDLHEELGLFLLKAIALVAPVPRQEDVGNDAFATLIRPEGSRWLIPDVSFLVQLKSASVASVSYTTPDEMAWISALDFPLFIGRVDLKQARIELFTTLRLHQILLEHDYDGIELLLNQADGISTMPNVRRANLGPPIHAWSVADVTEPGFLARSYAVLRPHVDTLRRNRSLRGIQSQRILRWETGQPPTDNGEMMLISPQNDIADTLRDMAPHARRLLMELQHRKRYGDFPVMLAFFDLMRRWGADPDPDGTLCRGAGSMADGPEISVEDAIRIRHAFQFQPAARKYWRREGGKLHFSPPHRALRLRFHSETRLKRHVKVQNHRSPYDGDWPYWSERLGRHPGSQPE